MTSGKPGGAVTGSLSEPLTLDILPRADTRRWVAQKKAQVVAAIRGGLISRQEACDRYSISNAELFSWEELLDQHGLQGLRTTFTQKYRRTSHLNLSEEPAD
jgi:transposase-like protein